MAVGRLTQKKPDPCCFVIFGVTGDLTHRLVMPSLYNLAAAGLLPERFCVVGGVNDHIAKLKQLANVGVKQFNVYLMNGNEEEQLEIYGEKIIPALKALTGWRYLRPPLEPLDEASAEALLSRRA